MLDEAAVVLLKEAKKRYAKNPSHAKWAEDIEEGCHCPLSSVAYVSAKMYGGPISEHSSAALKYLSSALPDAYSDDGTYAGLIAYNAEHSTEEVLNLFDRACQI